MNIKQLSCGKDTFSNHLRALADLLDSQKPAVEKVFRPESIAVKPIEYFEWTPQKVNKHPDGFYTINIFDYLVNNTILKGNSVRVTLENGSTYLLSVDELKKPVSVSPPIAKEGKPICRLQSYKVPEGLL